MIRDELPLKEVSIENLFISGDKSTYEIPIYQRNYAWGKDEITTLVQDVYDAYKKNSQKIYYIGTLVTYHKGDGVFEIIDGQQRLTTIIIILNALNVDIQNKLTYRARKKSDDTLKSIPHFNVDEKDKAIENGFEYARNAINDIIPDDERISFTVFFKSQVHIIHYRVPKDIDLNHYFEIMNSRGEQLEKHEIVKANLMEKLTAEEDRLLFNSVWEGCSELSSYIQQNIQDIDVVGLFGYTLQEFKPKDYNALLSLFGQKQFGHNQEKIKILDVINPKETDQWIQLEENGDRKDSFQPIIDFPNFLLVVLKYTLINRKDFDPLDFNLDDKELLNEFDKAKLDEPDVKQFTYNLLKARYLLDNYIVHHSKEEDTIDSNPWKLQVWHRDELTKKGQLKNLCENREQQDRLVQILSMFEVSFTARQRKNYLFYCLKYLIPLETIIVEQYIGFAENLADRYFNTVYLVKGKLNSKNTPLPGSFDEAMLNDKGKTPQKQISDFICIYGDGESPVDSSNIPLFVFNYMDYKLWSKYESELRGEKSKKGSSERENFFASLGCSDFELDAFNKFYFSRTRRSLEHYFPQANADGQNGNPNAAQINCFGNYAMIGSEANSSGSNWSPKTKLDHYLDSSGKVNQISVASLKFLIMLQKCRDDGEWEFDQIQEHQNKMLDILFEIPD